MNPPPPYSLLQTQTVSRHNLGRNAWMEIAQKLVAVGVVSAVSGTNGFQWCFAFTMMMAATSSMVQPYAQPQARLHVLESCSMDPKHFFEGKSLEDNLDKIHTK